MRSRLYTIYGFLSILPVGRRGLQVRVLTVACIEDNVTEDTFVCDDCGEEFPVSEEANNGVCDWCFLVIGA